MAKLSGQVVQEKKLYEGVFTAKVMCVNPSADEIKELTDGKLDVSDTPSERTSTTTNGTQYVQKRTRFLLKLTKDDNPVLEEDEYTLMDFYTRDLSVDGGSGYWVGTSAGQLIYIKGAEDQEDAVNQAKAGPRDYHVKDAASASVLGNNENQLFHFLSKTFNLSPYADGISANFKELYFPDMYAEDGTNFDDLNDDLEAFNHPDVRVLLYVDDRGYQKVDVRNCLRTCFSSTDKSFANRLKKSIEAQEEKGLKLINDAAGSVKIAQQVHDPMEAVNEESTSTDISSAADALG